jgi:hypothetical protein
MKRMLVLIVAVGLLSTRSAQAASTDQATARPAVWRAFQGLAARLSLDRPYRRDDYPPVEGASARLSFRQVENPTRFNIFRYLRIGKEGLKLAVYF